MSQNKTVFPGVGQEADNLTQYNHQPSGFDNYSRSSNSNRGAGTVYPGMENNISNSQVKETNNRQMDNRKPVVGFLYSVSRTGIGEYWPIHIGQNLIGSSASCDIVLNEATVSQRHAVLHVNKMKKPEKIEATISDSQSTNGTMLNGNSVSVARPPECVSGDIITIGENYELLFILIDVKACGLAPSEHFMPIESNEEEAYNAEYSQGASQERGTQYDFPPRFMGPESQYDSSFRPTDSTVGLDPSSNNGYNKGGTVGID